LVEGGLSFIGRYSDKISEAEVAQEPVEGTCQKNLKIYRRKREEKLGGKKKKKLCGVKRWGKKGALHERDPCNE